MAADWFARVSPRRLVMWAGLLWVINLFVLGPIAVTAAGFGNSGHRLDIHHIPWLTALVWAPLIEELVFRYGLRHPLQALWMLPLLVPVLLTGPALWSGLVLALVLLLSFLPPCRWRPAPRLRVTAWRRFYCRRFGWVFHASSLAFAAMHLNNFDLDATPGWLFPLLVLPQWGTGLVLGWMRTRRGIGAAVLLHALFNGGPLLVVALLLRWMPSNLA